jgi:hypothetical protein
LAENRKLLVLSISKVYFNKNNVGNFIAISFANNICDNCWKFIFFLLKCFKILEGTLMGGFIFTSAQQQQQ